MIDCNHTQLWDDDNNVFEAIFIRDTTVGVDEVDLQFYWPNRELFWDDEEHWAPSVRFITLDINDDRSFPLPKNWIAL